MNKSSGVNTITLQILALVYISWITSDQVTYPCCACFPNSNNRITFYLTACSGYYVREFTDIKNRASGKKKKRIGPCTQKAQLLGITVYQ